MPTNIRKIVLIAAGWSALTTQASAGFSFTSLGGTIRTSSLPSPFALPNATGVHEVGTPLGVYEFGALNSAGQWVSGTFMFEHSASMTALVSPTRIEARLEALVSFAPVTLPSEPVDWGSGWYTAGGTSTMQFSLDEPALVRARGNIDPFSFGGLSISGPGFLRRWFISEDVVLQPGTYTIDMTRNCGYGFEGNRYPNGTVSATSLLTLEIIPSPSTAFVMLATAPILLRRRRTTQR